MKKFHELSSFVNEGISESVRGLSEDDTHLIIDAIPNKNVELISFLKLKKECSFNTLIDVTAIDYPDRKQRFDIVYHLLSMSENTRCRVICPIEDGQEINSITSIFECANWFEREVFDLYGVKFRSHPDLRRILTDYGFNGHPLRKDFPTTGFLEVRYDEEQKRVVYGPTSLVQEYRDMDFVSPWDNPEAFLTKENKETNR
jgi:NADH-quinone oxidoreductase subunit C